MAHSLRIFFKNALIRYCAIAATIMIIAQAVILYQVISQRPETVFLHYTTYLGVDYIGPWQTVYLIPAASFGIFAIHFILAFYLSKKDILFGYLLSVSSALTALFLLIYSVLITRLNA